MVFANLYAHLLVSLMIVYIRFLWWPPESKRDGQHLNTLYIAFAKANASFFVLFEPY